MFMIQTMLIQTYYLLRDVACQGHLACTNSSVRGHIMNY